MKMKSSVNQWTFYGGTFQFDEIQVLDQGSDNSFGDAT